MDPDTSRLILTIIALVVAIVGLVVPFRLARQGRKETAKKLEDTTERLRKLQGKAAEEQQESNKELIDRATMIISMTIDKRFLEAKRSVRRVAIVAVTCLFTLLLAVVLAWLGLPQ